MAYFPGDHGADTQQHFHSLPRFELSVFDPRAGFQHLVPVFDRPPGTVVVDHGERLLEVLDRFSGKQHPLNRVLVAVEFVDSHDVYRDKRILLRIVLRWKQLT